MGSSPTGPDYNPQTERSKNQIVTRHLKGIIFDLDGVIADTEDLHRRAYNLAFEEANLGVRWSYQDYRDRLVLSGGKKLQTIEFPGESEEFRRRLYERKRFHYCRLLETEPLEPRPGVIRLVDEALSEGIPVAAASTCAREGALKILQEALGTERTSRFATIKAGDDAPRRKPAPDVYLLALSDLGVPAPYCVAIEDSRHGMLAAKSAGLWTLVTPSLYTRGDDFEEADCVVEDLETGPVTIPFLDEQVGKAGTRSLEPKTD